MKFLVASVFLVTLFAFSSAQIIKVREAVWVDIGVTQKFRTSVNVAEGSSLRDVMEAAAAEDPDYEFEDDGDVVTKIGDNEHDPSNNKHWLIFELDQVPDKKNPPGADQLASAGIHDLTVQKNKVYLFWLRPDL